MLFIALSCKCWAQLPQTSWASVFYGLTPPTSIDCAVDAFGNSYVLGEFSGIADFDPSAAVYPLNSNAGNIFIVKLDDAGGLIWAKQFGGLTAYTTAIEVDQAGSAFITGSFYSTGVDFDPGPAVQTLASFGGYLMKLSSAGTFVWARNIGGPVMIVREMAIDSLGSPVVTGNFQGTVDFDPGIGALELTSAGGDDAFVTKYSSLGDLSWAVALGGPGNEDGLTIATDNDGYTYVGGFFHDGADFDPGPSSYALTSVGGGDAYVCRLSPQGALDWAVGMGSAAVNYADATRALTISNDQVVAVGSFTESADFDPTGGSAILSSAGGVDVFVSRFTTDGLFNGVSQIGGWEGNEFCSRAVTDPSGAIILSGSFQGTVDFDPGAADASLTAGLYGLFVCRWNSMAEYEWAFSSSVEAVSSPGADVVYCIGTCSAGSDVDPSASVFQVSQAGALTMKLDQLGTTGVQPTNQSSEITVHSVVGAEYAWRVSFPQTDRRSAFRLVDLTGRTIQTGRIESGSSGITVDLLQCASGLYLIELLHVQGAIRILR